MASLSVAAERAVGAARFDWYSATIPDSVESVLEVLADGLGATVEPGQALHGYERGDDLRRDGSTVARVLSGGRNGHPHAWASSDDTDEFVRAVNKYHRLEEARHLSFARATYPDVWSRASWLDRFLVKHVAPHLVRFMFESMGHPGVNASDGSNVHGNEVKISWIAIA